MTATAPSRNSTAEHARLAQASGPAEDNLFESNPWYEWGPYLSERAWGPHARTTATAVMPGPGTPSAVGPAASTRCLDRRRAPVDCLARPLVTGWVAQSEIGVGAFMISSALATRDEAFGSPCCINTVDRTNGRYPLSEQDRGRPGPHPTSRTRSPAWS
jgi:hypothetical protein